MELEELKGTNHTKSKEHGLSILEKSLTNKIIKMEKEETEIEKISHILFHEYSWNSKEIDEGEFKIQDVIDATNHLFESQAKEIEELKQQKKTLEPFFKVKEENTKLKERVSVLEEILRNLHKVEPLSKEVLELLTK